jgi:F-type H+-transporting ATPase subunit b
VTFHRRVLRRGYILIGGLAVCPFIPVLGWAAEGQASWRATYDLVMMWVNFGILAFLLAKYVRTPLVNLLKGEAEKAAAVLKTVQEGKERVDQEVQDTMRALVNARERLRDAQEKILREGTLQRQRIIDSARSESRLLIERTRQKIDAQIAEAHQRLRSDLIDRAIAVALERIPTEITTEEQFQLVDRFVRETHPS